MSSVWGEWAFSWALHTEKRGKKILFLTKKKKNQLNTLRILICPEQTFRYLVYMLLILYQPLYFFPLSVHKHYLLQQKWCSVLAAWNTVSVWPIRNLAVLLLSYCTLSAFCSSGLVSFAPPSLLRCSQPRMAVLQSQTAELEGNVVSSVLRVSHTWCLLAVTKCVGISLC